MSYLITQAEAARLRRVSPQAINDLIKRGKLKTRTVGGIVFVVTKSVQNYKPGTGGRPNSKSKTRRRASSKQANRNS